MAALIYTGIVSLDGYIEDAAGTFDWSAPDEEVHRFVNDLERSIGTHLYGRRLYEVMAFWEDSEALREQPDYIRDYAEIWQAAEKVVYSGTLEAATTARTRIERTFDPEAVRRLKAEAGADLGIGGAELAAHAVRAGLVDEYCLFVSPVVVGGGKRYLPDGVRLDLELVDERRFGNGVVYARYRVRS